MSRFEECNTWLQNKQLLIEGANIGSNRIAIIESLVEHKKLFDAVRDFDKEIDKLSPQESQNLKKTHYSLLALVLKQNQCLESLLDLQSVEETFESLAGDVVQKSISLSDKLQKIAEVNVIGTKSSSEINVYQNCILSLKNCWEWLNELMGCTEQHLKDAGEYHQFRHALHEYLEWMPVDMNKTSQLLDVVQIKSNNHGLIINELLRDIKNATAIFLRWQSRMDGLLHKVRSIAPISLRMTRVTAPRPSFVLVHYITKRAHVKEGEEVMLLDNSKIRTWTIRNLKGDTFDVPSIIVRIPGPDEDLLQRAMELILQLLSNWTSMIKRYGKTIILFLLHVIKIWTPSEEQLLVTLPQQEKKEVKLLLEMIEKTFSQHWLEHPAYKELYRRIMHLKSLLQQTTEKSRSGLLLIIQTHLLEELLFNFMGFWKHWETYKVLTERIKHPECLLSVSNWKQYHFLQLADWLKTWQVSLDFDESDFESFGHSFMDEQIQVEMEKKLATTSQMFSSEQEENQTFIITGVTDPLTGELISLDEAVIKGIINQSEGRYIRNINTGESIPILVAMNAGDIKVEVVKVKKSEERIKDVGLIDIKMIKETRPYTLKGVRDPRKQDIISIDEAVRRGILDQKNNSYRDQVTGNILTLAEALDSGLLLVDFLSDTNSHLDPVIESKTYMVNGVTDHKSQQLYTFSEAVREGLINPDNGSYHDTLWKKDIYIGDAIKEGYVKAILVKNATCLDINPANKILVNKDRLQFFKQAVFNMIRM